MNRLAIILAILVWVVVLAVIGSSFIFGEKEDPQRVIRQLVTIARQYVEGQEVDRSVIKGEGPSYDFLRIMANHFHEKQQIETQLNTETKTLIATLSIDNISNPVLLDQSIARAENYVTVVQQKEKEFRESIDKMVAAIRDMRGESEIFDVDVTIAESVDILKTHEAQAKMRVALGQYAKALLDFVKSRTGYYTVEEKRLVFKIPEDQAYYDQIMAQTNDIYNKLSDMIAAERNEFRSQLSKINI